MALAQALKQQARALGADLVGIAPALPRPEAAWLPQRVAGWADALPFLKRDMDVRQDIRRWYPQARSVLVCGFSCGSPGRSAGPRTQARIAGYAARQDYHRVLKGRMQDLLAWLQDREPGSSGRAFVDTSPVLERVYGAAAGLGWIGRNGLLVSQTAGSLFLIAGLALDRRLKADSPAPGRCGSCRRCLDACPTGALAQGRFDPRLCAAYLTVEHRGAIPAESRAGVGRWVAGCDACQEACPWNSRAKAASVLESVLAAPPSLEELALLDERGFRDMFGATPLARLKRQGMARNALLAMGNSGEKAYRPALERLGAGPDPVLREQARWSLARLAGEVPG